MVPTATRQAVRGSELAGLLVVFALTIAFNLSKAFHIDDTSVLEVAFAILDDPLHPMSGEVNWIDVARPIHELNQPHLHYYLVAALLALAGPSEHSLHAFLSIWPALAIWIFFLLVRRYRRDSALLYTGLLMLNPLVLPSQNLMQDVPLLGAWTAFLWAVLECAPRSRWGYPLAGLIVAAACLIKYVSLVLMPVLLLSIAWRREWRFLWTLAIPIAALGLWSLFNWLDYGGFHILERSPRGLSADRLGDMAIEWLVVLGLAAVPVVVAAATRFARANSGAWIAAGGTFLAVFAFSRASPRADLQASIGLAALCASGVFYACLVLPASLRALLRTEEAHDTAVLLGLILLALLFVVGFAPFAAVRHLIPVLPAIFLLLARQETRWSTPGGLRAALVVSFAAGAAVATADLLWAEVYRKAAPEIAAILSEDDGREGVSNGPMGRPDRTTWFLGHWGWQWYASRAGMAMYETGESALDPGDRVVVPQLVHRQELDPRDRDRLRATRRLQYHAGPLGWLKTMAPRPRGGLYEYSWKARSFPLRFSSDPLESFTVYEVTAPERRRNSGGLTTDEVRRVNCRGELESLSPGRR